jgi:hypothetical protein
LIDRVLLAGLAAIFGLLTMTLPIGSTIRIGADEGFELAEATLVAKGHKFYSEIWNDQRNPFGTT